MTEKEKLMYQILGEISEVNVPIVFKGALITKLVLAENGFREVGRSTKDIYANWVGIPPSMSDLKDTINYSLKAFNGEFHAEIFREYGYKKSAGLSIVETATGIDIVEMDIDIRSVMGSKIYHYGEMSIKGVLPNEILADKITVLSNKYIFRRAKDMIDVYSLSHCVDVSTSDIFEIFERKNLDVGTFNEFFTRRLDVEHSYEKLNGIENKPSFEQVYSHLSIFILPFANKNTVSRVWDSSKLLWEEDCKTHIKF